MITKRKLINLLESTPQSDDTPVVVFLNVDEDIENIIDDIAFIDSVDDSISNRIDLNIVYRSYYYGY